MNVTRTVVIGLIATASMTALLMVEPSVGLPEIAIGQVLSTSLGLTAAHLESGAAVGWLLHFLVGSIWAVVYGAVVVGRLPGPPVVRGLLFGFLVFLLAQAVFMPLVGGGIFSGGDPLMLAGSLLGHLVYGSVLGWVYGGAGLTEAGAAMPRTA
ncbi:MAG TPA: DUF6789 family protein [Gemmatimonadales bacterium]|nr:DUF6789 family protein [Gemmatimonadales bacterium]